VFNKEVVVKGKKYAFCARRGGGSRPGVEKGVNNHLNIPPGGGSPKESWGVPDARIASVKEKKKENFPASKKGSSTRAWPRKGPFF